MLIAETLDVAKVEADDVAINRLPPAERKFQLFVEPEPSERAN